MHSPLNFKRSCFSNVYLFSHIYLPRKSTGLWGHVYSNHQTLQQRDLCGVCIYRQNSFSYDKKWGIYNCNGFLRHLSSMWYLSNSYTPFSYSCFDIGKNSEKITYLFSNATVTYIPLVPRPIHTVILNYNMTMELESTWVFHQEL